MEKIHCPKCNGISVKNGFQNKTQRYKCKVCNKRFQVSYTYKAYNSNTNEFIIDLLKEGCGLRSISRILKISKNTVLSRMLKISNSIKVPYFDKQGCKFEIDEMFIKIANGENQNWLIYGIERVTKSLIGFVIGGRTKENISQLINKILLLNPKRIYTDRLNIYPSLIPKEIHRRFRYCTNKIERMNLTLRTHIKRLSRKTICFSRKQEYLEAHLRIYFWG
ncbi:IS1 family transposase [Dokdonia pacifica]|uniref:Transposase and inactivated derivatives, IS1 family n=1 Tax=Dokdonia pacifica TaxID=1627892 RepID=A0A239E841_9FLAO|nr:IS1 family transposase [Dokdonia pacifica]GGG25116.1 IS1 family transposase [Dokdonia pacifica]SNS40054.1 Transposase and inactivated derivatives, IS1 family [Dokdonia pacifica]